MKIITTAALALLAAPVAAGAQDSMAAERDCVFDRLTPGEWVAVERFSAEEVPEDVADRVNDLLDVHAEACAAAYGWGEARTQASGDHAVARVRPRVTEATLPERLSPAALEAVAGTLSNDDQARFVPEFAAELGPDESWIERVSAALTASGVAEDDVPLAGAYIEAWYGEMYTAFAFNEARDAEAR